MLTPNELVLILIIGGALALILSNRIEADLVAILVLLALGFTGLTTPQQTLAGLSSPVVVTIIGLFVITRALEDSGVIQWIADRIKVIGRGSEARLVFIFMAAAALLSLVMNNIAAGAVLLPAAVRVGRVSNVRLSKLLMPLSFGTLVGGMATYLTTANIVLSGVLQSQGLAGLGMRSFVPTGALIVAATLVYMLLVGRRLLPTRDTITQSVSAGNLAETYQLGDRMWEVRVAPQSQLVGQSLSTSGIGEQLGLTVLAVWHGKQAVLTPTPEQVISADDYLLVLGRKDRVEQLVQWGTTVRDGRVRLNGGSSGYDVDLVEVVVPPRSGAVGRTLTDLRFRGKYGGLTAAALWRNGQVFRTDVGKRPLEVGDALLVVGPSAGVKTLATGRDFLVLNAPSSQPLQPVKAFWALLITAVVLLISIFDWLPLPEVMLAGAAALVLARVLNMADAYRAVEWRVVFLIAGFLPLSTALAQTGLAERVGTALVTALAGYGGLALIAGLFLLTVGVTQIIGGQVTALVVGPLAISAAVQAGINPQAMAVAVAIGCSTAFLTPLSHPVNVLMMGPAGYTFGDFPRIGFGMTVITFGMLLVGLVLFWGVS